MNEPIALPNVSGLLGGRSRRIDPNSAFRRETRKLSKGLPFSECETCGATWSPDDSDTCESCEV